MDWKPEWMRDVLRVYEISVTPIGGAVPPGNEVMKATQIPRYVEMELLSYSSWDPIHGVFCVERDMIAPKYPEPRVTHFFFGYKCHTCGQVFLIPNSVQSDYDLFRNLQHKCELKGKNAQFIQVPSLPRSS